MIDNSLLITFVRLARDVGKPRAAHTGLVNWMKSVGRELRTSPSGIGNSSYELPEDLQGCDEAALPLSHTKLLVRGGT